MTGRILVADDERGLLETLEYVLRHDGFEVECVEEGEAALAAARTGRYDVLVLDVMMPKLSGLDVCRTLRGETDLPIVMLTAKDAEHDRVLGLELGADDYVTKPFSISELVSRIRALIRRRQLDRSARAAAIRVVDGIRIDFAENRVEVDGRPVRLTPSEFKLLALLADEPEHVFTRQQLMEHLWEAPYFGDPRACDVHISNLRRKVERDPGRPKRIVTVREVGYKLVAV